MLEVEFLIKTFGYLGLFAIVFAETGLFFGFFLPGDSLLFTAGILASRDILSIVPLCAIVFSAAVIGDTTGYWIGHHFGKKLFKKEDSIFFHKNHL
ncbi:MAG: DedA family protein, partial [bacterium]|nr:DedA family protein [bacterium]